MVLLVAIVAGIVAVRQLGAGAAESRRLFDIEERLDNLARTQLDAETALRGYLITRDNQFLEPGLSGEDPFEQQLTELSDRLQAADLEAARPFLERVLGFHRDWERLVAGPLIRDPSRASIADHETIGKMISDRIRTESDAVRRLVDSKYDDAEGSLAANIDGTVEYAIAFVLLFALAGFYLTIVQRRTVAALERQHSIASGLQAALGVGWQSIPGSTVGTAYVSASRETDVGGDLFDAWRIDDDRGAILIADMSGKGIDAVLNTAFCKYSIRAFLDVCDDPAKVMADFNRLFMRTVSDPSMFAVAFLGVVNAGSRTFQYVSAGHEPAFLRTGGEVRQLDIGGPIVGILPDATFSVTTIALRRGDTVVLATDGLTESRNSSGEFLEGAGAQRLIGSAPLEPQLLCDTLIAAVSERSGGRIADDLALLALRFDGQRGIVAEAS